ncbi:hypothetical protein HYPSUDRAFT_208878 [Hypholoma sublateritium FD-334 SS-4]|uniref:Extracellular membrane protein CFEM domain-containing protein n=1 Tax=Hypholoma sublateritium (strain FD-334 SS-4) TaxID=945553 RepID=A0A0D2NCG8_HYPSF|nr:hypothetical protein HYPSUDRAFT_208878 [Hypholoma sublateritium FD-334 SS-4]
MFRLATALYMTVTGTMALRIMAGITFDTGGIHALVSRQTGTNPAPPTQCATPCNAIESMISNGCQISTCCLTSFVTNYFNCFECLGQVDNTTDYTTQQNTINEIEQSCALAGVSLPPVTFPGQSPDSTIVVSPPSTAATSTSISTQAPGLPTSQSTITTVPLTRTAPQTTITSLSTDTPSPSPTTTSGGLPTSVPHTNLGLWTYTALIGLFFYRLL